MEKMAGRFLFVFIFLLTSLSVQASQQSIVLSIHDMDNKPIKQAMVKSQFILQASWNNLDGVKDIPIVPGIEKFQYTFAGKQSNISIHNGKRISRIVYNFIVRADEQGLYEVGPIVHSDMTYRTIQSNILSIKVGDEIIWTQHEDATEKNQVITKLEKNSVYVGEKVSLSIDFLDNLFTDQYSLILPDFENIITKNVEQKERVTLQHHNAKEYADTKWTMDLYPKAPGVCVIEKVKIRFVDSQYQDSIFGQSFFGMFNPMFNEQEITARPIGLQVKELPKIQGFQDVTAVGQFSKLEVSVNKNSVEQRQGIVLSVNIFGDGNFEMIQAPQLLLPDDFTYYDSQAPEIDKNRTCKRFEYIIQAHAPGQYHIPAQKISYFNPINGQYTTLQSNFLDISVTENLSVQPYQEPLPEGDDERDYDEKPIRDYGVIEDQIDCAKRSFIMIPAWWYSLLLFLVCLIFFLMVIYRYIIQKYLFTHQLFRHYLLFFHAYRACNAAKKNDDVAVLHALFIRLFIGLKVGSLGLIRDEMIEKYLKKNGFSDQLIEEWRIFYNQLLQASFAQPWTQDNSILFKNAFTWLARLKEQM